MARARRGDRALPGPGRRRGDRRARLGRRLAPWDSTSPTTEVLTQGDGRFTLPARRSRHEWPRLALFKAGYGGWRIEGGIDALLTDGARIELRPLRHPAAQRAYLEGRHHPADGVSLETRWREARGPDIPFGVRRAAARCYEAALNAARARVGLPPIEVHAMDRLRPSTRTTGRSCTPARPAGQDGEIQPVGGSRPVHVDVRLAAAPWPRNVRELETLLLNPWTRKVLVAANLEALTRAFVVSPTGFEPVFPD